MFTKGGEAILSVPLIFFSIDVTTGGVYSGLVIAFPFLTINMGSALFIFTTGPTCMSEGLPYRFGFMPVFEEDASTVRGAQAARGLKLTGKG